MNLLRKINLAFHAWRDHRKGANMANAVLTSKTTQNTAMGVGGVAGTVYAIIQFLRTMKPELLPWDADGDGAIVAVIATVIGPLVSRMIAMRRNPEKKTKAESKAAVDGSAFAEALRHEAELMPSEPPPDTPTESLPVAEWAVSITGPWHKPAGNRARVLADAIAEGAQYVTVAGRGTYDVKNGRWF